MVKQDDQGAPESAQDSSSFLTVEGTADGSAREADDTPKAISWKFMVFHCPTCRSPVRERFGATCADDWHDHVTGWVAPDQPAIMIMGNGPHLPPPCTCHPDDNPPRPCPRKYAYSECVKAAAADTARDAERTGQQTRPKSSWELRAEAAEAEIARLSLQLHEAQKERDISDLQVAGFKGDLAALSSQLAGLRNFTESMAITFRNYYGHAISRSVVDAKLQEWLELRAALAVSQEPPQTEKS